MDIYTQTQFLLKKYNVKINKNFGQNFLIDENTVEKIIESSDIKKDELIIEIGPGLGVLTERLLEKAYKVIAIELDENMVTIISNRFKNYNNLEIINNDILKVDLNKIIEINKKIALESGITISKVKVIANLPYYISTPIIMNLLEEKIKIDSIIVMVQKEVAQRLIAIPGSKLSGSITYIVDYYTVAKKIVDVNNKSFIPSPKVDSMVIKLDLRKNPKVCILNEKKFFGLIKNVFMQRRKTLINTLVNFNYVKDKQDASDILKKMNFKDDIRGETLNLEEFAKLQELLQ